MPPRLEDEKEIKESELPPKLGGQSHSAASAMTRGVVPNGRSLDHVAEGGATAMAV